MKLKETPVIWRSKYVHTGGVGGVGAAADTLVMK